MKKNKISILMTCFNASKYLNLSIKSILNQKYRNWELIIIDDFSSDKSTELVSKFKNKKIKLYRLKKHIGRTESLNYGLKKIKSEFIAILDADDISLKNRLYDQINFLNKNKNIDLVGTWSSIIDEKSKTLKSQVVRPRLKNLRNNMIFENVFSHSSVMFRKKIFKKVKKYPSEFVYMQDYAFLLNIMKYYKISIIPKILSQNRVVKSSMTFTVPSNEILAEKIKLLHYTSNNFSLNFSTRIFWFIEYVKTRLKFLSF